MVAEAVACELCGLPTTYPITDNAGRPFCCPACREVSALLAAELPARSNPQPESATAVTETTTLSLSGLWCPSCAWLIGEGLRRAPGVQAADVSFIQREARISYDPGRTNERGLARQVKRLGYGAWAAGDKAHDEEEAHWTRLLISGVAAMHVMVLSFMLYLRQWTGHASPDTQWLADFFELMIMVASVPVVLILGLPILRAGLASLLRGRPNTHTLIALGAFSAFGLSLRNFLAGTGGIYFDTAAVLLFLVALGRWFEVRAQKVSGQAVERLWQELPDEATQITAAGEVRRLAGELPVGSRVRVRPGGRFPVDALIAVGEGDVDESLVTGEPEPVARRAGDRVLAGTVSLDGAFEVITTAVGPDTVVGQIGRLLHQAMWQRAPVERLADKLAALMTPTAVILSAATFAYWNWQAGLETGLIHALSVLLIACPCALGIATPLTLWLGLGRATEAGLILRNTGVLEQLASVERVFFDKTGTITQRPIRLQAVATEDGDEERFLSRVTAVETPSEHPLAQAIVNGAQARLTSRQPPTPSANFQALPGLGVSGEVAETAVWIGSRRLMANQGLELSPALAQTAQAWQQKGLTVVYAGWNGHVAGLLGLGETARPETVETIARLQARGLSVALLTGDDQAAGQRWQRELGVPVFAGLRPEGKVAQLQSGSGGALMVGDGINDGPALAAATVGLALSQGTDVAQTAADGIILADDLRAVPWLLNLAKITLRKVRQNLAWAFFYNLIGLALAVNGRLQPELAALFMVISNIIVTSNALRLRKAVFSEQWPVNSDPLPAAGDRFSVTGNQLSAIDHKPQINTRTPIIEN